VEACVEKGGVGEASDHHSLGGTERNRSLLRSLKQTPESWTHGEERGPSKKFATRRLGYQWKISPKRRKGRSREENVEGRLRN